MQIRKKLGISVPLIYEAGAFNLWWRHQKKNDVSKYLTMTFSSEKVDDLLTICQSREQRAGEGGIRPPHDYEGQKYAMTKRVNSSPQYLLVQKMIALGPNNIWLLLKLLVVFNFYLECYLCWKNRKSWI